MKAIMSDKLRKIIQDPHKSKELYEGFERLRSAHSHTARKMAKINIGGQVYKIQFVSPTDTDK